jgi:sugar phosphate isomerase/epimerase
MRFGAMNHPVRPVLEEVARLARLGFDYLELALDPPEGHHQRLAPLVPALRDALEGHGMGLVAHLPTFVSTADLAPAVRGAARAEMRASLDLAAALGARYAVVHPGLPVGMGRQLLPRVKELALEGLGELVDAARGLGMVLGLENMFPACGHFFAPEDLEAAFRRFPSLRLTLDVGHAHIGAPDGARCAALLACCGSRLGHVHLSDNRGKHDDHLPLGGGGIDFAAVLGALKVRGYDGTLTLEIFGDDPQGLPLSLKRIKRLAAAA